MVGWAWWVAAVGLSGCGATRYIYTVEPLPAVIRPSGQPWDVEVALDVTDAIHLEVVNESQEPVRMVWEDCVYIDVDGRSHRLQTAGGGSGAGVPVSVAPGSRLVQALLPVGDPFGHSDDPLLPGRPKPAQSGLRRWLWPFGRAPAHHRVVGKTIGLFLVLERGGRQRTITATYAITGVRRT